MIYHPLDFWILEKILERKDTTTWEIAEKFPWEDKPDSFKNNKQREDFLVEKTDCIYKRLRIMSKEGIVKICKGNPNRGNKNIYIVDSKKVILKRCKFPDNYGKALFIKEKDKKWQVFQI